MNRDARVKIAEETVRILHSCRYTAPSGTQVSIAEDLARSRAETRLFRPGDLDQLLQDVAAKTPRSGATSIRVNEVGTLDAGRALFRQFDHVACLNFASAKNPGGGFRTGAQAQEESLARASGLVATLEAQPEYYEFHRQQGTCLYSDHIIFSPRVPVFRDGGDQLLEEPWTTSMITAAAVNAGALRKNEPSRVGEIRSTLERRARGVLAVAAACDCDALVLGAWGCGVFQNDPGEVAAIFAAALEDPTFKDRFRHVEFAILDRSPGRSTLKAFEAVLGA